jgi:2-keto-4-pentenoate hydratase
MAVFDPAPAADVLVAAFRGGRQVAGLPDDARPADLAQGYDVQDKVAEIIGDRIAGWKLGLGSANAMRAASLRRPVIGRVFGSRLARSGETVNLPVEAPILVEIEIAVVLARDVAPGDSVDPRSCIASAHIASELVQSRFFDRTTVGLPSFVADSVGFAALVVGHTVDIAKLRDIVDGIVVSVDGRESARGLKGDDAIDPIEMLGHLMAHARERGMTLRRDEVVTTGTITKPFDVTARRAGVTVRAPGVELDYRIAAGS